MPIKLEVLVEYKIVPYVYINPNTTTCSNCLFFSALNIQNFYIMIENTESSFTLVRYELKSRDCEIICAIHHKEEIDKCR